MDLNRVIGKHGMLPWKPMSEDLRWFKHFTMGKTVLMGRTTYEGMPQLKGRKICVVTSNALTAFKNNNTKNELYACSPLHITQLVLTNPSDWEDAIVAGGAKTYKLLLPYCTDLYMTHVLDEYEGDTYMPPFEYGFPNQTIIHECKEFWVVRYYK